MQIEKRKTQPTLVRIEQAKQLLANANIDEAIDLRDRMGAVADYLKARDYSYEAQCNASEIKLRAERRVGEILAGMKLRGGDRKTNSHDASLKLSNLGIKSDQSSRWQQEAKVPESKFESWVGTVRKNGDEITQNGLLNLAKCGSVAAASNTGEVEWYTPWEYVELAIQVMGSIDLDPASCDAANEVVRAAKYFTTKDDGLSRIWGGNVWMNPPYASGIVSCFTTKLVSEFKNGNVTQAIVLLNNSTDTAWFYDLVTWSHAVCFKTGRIAFMDVTGASVSGAAQGQVFLYFGRRVKRFLSVFNKIGWTAEVNNEW